MTSEFEPKIIAGGFVVTTPRSTIFWLLERSTDGPLLTLARLNLLPKEC